MDADYVFRVRVRLEPETPDVSVEPATFETVLRKRAAPPGEDDWLFFRDHLWHGELGDEEHFREMTEDALGLPVTSVSFSELETDEAYLDALRAEIGEQLDEFKADGVDRAVSKYLGSSIRVVPDGA